jgi:two-component system chemotaxis response regulator CheY
VSSSFLVVDDSPVGRKILRRALAMVGVDGGSVQEAEDGLAALELLRARPIDVVVTDIHMPRMDGIELVRQMRADGRLAKTAVIVVSSDRNDGRQQELRKLGACAYVVKPLRPEELRDAVEAACGGAS